MAEFRLVYPTSGIAIAALGSTYETEAVLRKNHSGYLFLQAF